MLRAVLAVVLSYLLMVALLFPLLTGAYFALGTEGTFKPLSFEVSNSWIIAFVGILFVVGVIGGYVCALISGSNRTPLALALVMLALGVASALFIMLGPTQATEIREGTVDNLAAMTKARQPLWLEWAKPVIGAAGAILGARLKKT